MIKSKSGKKFYLSVVAVFVTLFVVIAVLERNSEINSAVTVEAFTWLIPILATAYLEIKTWTKEATPIQELTRRLCSVSAFQLTLSIISIRQITGSVAQIVFMTLCSALLIATGAFETCHHIRTFKKAMANAS